MGRSESSAAAVTRRNGERRLKRRRWVNIWYGLMLHMTIRTHTYMYIYIVPDIHLEDNLEKKNKIAAASRSHT